MIIGATIKAYTDYRKALLRINLFDEYCWLRAQELAKENEYLLEHEGTVFYHADLKKLIWWTADLKETITKVQRQGNSHTAEDFKDSELLLQDFIDRYIDPNVLKPLKDRQTLML